MKQRRGGETQKNARKEKEKEKFRGAFFCVVLEQSGPLSRLVVC